MKIAIIGDAARKDQDSPLIEKASQVFEDAVYAPTNEIMIRTGKGSGIVHKNRILSAFECILPIPGDNIEIFMAIASVLENTDVYTPYDMEGLLLFQRKVIGLAKLKEAGLPTQEFNYFLSDRSVESVIDKISFPVEVRMGSKSSIVGDDKHLSGMIKLRRSGETIWLREPITGPVIECMVVGNEVVAVVENSEEKKARSVKIGSSLQEIAVNAVKTLGSDYGFVSLNGDKIVTVSLSSNFSAIEKVTNKNISRTLLYHMRENAKMHERSILEKIVDVLKVPKI